MNAGIARPGGLCAHWLRIACRRPSRVLATRATWGRGLSPAVPTARDRLVGEHSALARGAIADKTKSSEACQHQRPRRGLRNRWPNTHLVRGEWLIGRHRAGIEIILVGDANADVGASKRPLEGTRRGRQFDPVTRVRSERYAREGRGKGAQACRQHGVVKGVRCYCRPGMYRTVVEERDREGPAIARVVRQNQEIYRRQSIPWWTCGKGVAERAAVRGRSMREPAWKTNINVII